MMPMPSTAEPAPGRTPQRRHLRSLPAANTGPKSEPGMWRFSPSRLRGHRERLGWTRAQLAIETGWKPSTIKAIEGGINSPSLELFLLLAGSLGITPVDLCRTSDDDRAEYQAGRQYPS